MTLTLNASVLEPKEDPDVIFNVNPQTHHHEPTTKVYKYRWIILLMFMISSGINSFQWIEYSIISDVVSKYYSVELVYVDSLSIIFMFACLLFNLPALWLFDKKGLRVITILGSACNCLAAWIKVMSVRPDLYYVAFIGQTVAGIGQVFLLNTPPRLAALWFGEDQVSTACAIAVFGDQVGVALGFLVPPALVEDSDDIEQIGDGLSAMFYVLAGICTVQLVLVILFFRAGPKLAPSHGQAAKDAENSAFFESLKRLSKNRGFVLLFFAHGLMMGVFNTFSTLLNQMVLTHFPGHDDDAGRIGLMIMVAGMFGTVVTGAILDKTRKFKETILATFVFSAAGLILFTFTLSNATIGIIYGIAAFLGFFMIAYFPGAFEFGSEITYPVPEEITAGMLNISMEIFGILLTFGAGAVLDSFGDLWSNGGFLICLLIGLILITLIKPDLRRQEANKL